MTNILSLQIVFKFNPITIRHAILKGFIEKNSGLALNKPTYGQNSDGRSNLEKFFGKNSYFLKPTYLGQFWTFWALVFRKHHELYNTIIICKEMLINWPRYVSFKNEVQLYEYLYHWSYHIMLYDMSFFRNIFVYIYTNYIHFVFLF